MLQPKIIRLADGQAALLKNLRRLGVGDQMESVLRALLVRAHCDGASRATVRYSAARGVVVVTDDSQGNIEPHLVFDIAETGAKAESAQAARSRIANLLSVAADFGVLWRKHWFKINVNEFLAQEQFEVYTSSTAIPGVCVTFSSVDWPDARNRFAQMVQGIPLRVDFRTDK